MYGNQLDTGYDNINKYILYLKVIQTDETAQKPDHVPVSSEDERNAVFQLEKAISSNKVTTSKGHFFIKMVQTYRDFYIDQVLYFEAHGIK